MSYGELILETCPTRECPFQQPDTVVYSLQDAILFNTEITVVLQCPSGYLCGPDWPKVVVYPPGTWVNPDPTPDPNGPPPEHPITLTLQGCQSAVSVTLPPTATQAQIRAAFQSLAQQVAEQQALCDNPPPNPIPTFFNHQVYYGISPCPDGETLVFDGSLPTWITIDQANSRLVGAAGTFGGDTQNAANQIAQNAINDFGSAAILSGKLHCEGDSDCPDWDTLTWGDTLISAVGGTASFSPTVGNQGSGFIGNANIDNSALSFVTFGVINPATLVYNGPGCNCNLVIDATWAPVICPDDAIFYFIEDSITGVITFGFIQTNGIHNIPFALPDTLAANHTISVTITFNLDNLTSGFTTARTLSITGAITNV